MVKPKVWSRSGLVVNLVVGFEPDLRSQELFD